jgi:hypothetical protein
MTNWKSTLFGVLLALSTAVTTGTVDTGSPQARNIAAIVQAVAAMGLGGSSKDKDVTGAGSSARRVAKD